MRPRDIDSLLAALVVWISFLVGAMVVVLWLDEGFDAQLGRRICESVTTCIALRDYRSQVRIQTSGEMRTNTIPPPELEGCPGRRW
jgi:hypothetical protein